MKTIKKNMEHSFNIAVAMEYGVLEAVIIRNFQYWISKNKANKAHFVNNHYWTYNSYDALVELFPYATKDQIKKRILRLVEKGVLIIGHFSEDSRDRTNWFAFADEARWIEQNGTMSVPNGTTNDAEKTDAECESARCINEYYNDTNNKHTDNKPNNKPECKPRVYEAEKFAPLNANDVAFADFYRKAFKTDFVWQENTSEAVQRLADCITDKGGDLETMPNNITRFLEACHRLNDQWLNQRFTPSLLAKQFNQLYQRITTNGNRQTATYRQGRADNPAGVSEEYLAKIAAELGGGI